MIKKIIWFLVLPIVIGVSIYFIFFNKKPATTTTPNNTNTTNTTTTNSDTTTNSNTTDTKTAPLTGFVTSDQTVGVASDSNFTLEKITNTGKTGYHEFTFTLSSTGTDNPYVLASYNSSLGVIRVTLRGVTTDDSGIGYQKQVDINKDGVLKLYHNISSDQTEELYDIGVSASTPFKLVSEKTSTGWTVTVDVQYPGASSSNALFIDAGSQVFSTEAQSLKGMISEGGAKVDSYTYSTSNNVFAFIWNVSSNTTDPIPQVTAQYDSSNNLVVTFVSLSSDKVVNGVNNTNFPGGMVLKSAKSSESSIYTFTGLTTKASYKLHTSVSPNQVILEIEL